jgi:hypothetical protein
MLKLASASLLALAFAGVAGAQALDPAALRPVGKVSERYQSYNVEMVEVTGGRFWKPYKFGPPADQVDRYRYRPPIDLANAKLRMLTRALGPAYVRVSGTWANTTWFADVGGAPKPPKGFEATLTRAQWRGVVGFARAVNAEIVTSFAGSAGARDAAGVWQPDQMRALIDYTRTVGGRITGAEFLNEPNLVSLTGAPADYDARAYGRDWDRFADAFRHAAPGAVLLGPGSVGEGGALDALATAAKIRLLPSADMLKASRTRPDVISYHHYPAMSERCGRGTPLSTTLDQAGTPDFLDRSARSAAFYVGLRDQLGPGAPVWLTETGQAACGGDRWASTFADTPRYLDQMGLLARAGVQVVMHNTLAASDYALLDEETFDPRPSYWGALLWARLMGTTVLNAVGASPTVRTYAHCLKGRRGGVAMLAINTGTAADLPLRSGGRAQAYILTAAGEHGVALNGRTLALRGGELPQLNASPTSGRVQLPAASVAFLALPDAGNPGCRGT